MSCPALIGPVLSSLSLPRTFLIRFVVSWPACCSACNLSNYPTNAALILHLEHSKKVSSVDHQIKSYIPQKEHQLQENLDNSWEQGRIQPSNMIVLRTDQWRHIRSCFCYDEIRQWRKFCRFSTPSFRLGVTREEASPIALSSQQGHLARRGRRAGVKPSATTTKRNFPPIGWHLLPRRRRTKKQTGKLRGVTQALTTPLPLFQNRRYRRNENGKIHDFVLCGMS